ncbi:hypothetical protein HNQ88_002075 [Aureibacter tunicatorum]|uniref:Uncharacterized protein n=1 Tax=Aureibacter tunicatorum TaxID=866807 RepID=A0AAE4BSP6_9BACT|nr:hypothetical protein [Aureibacter tunicatorum]BDD05036.1 hypothetical protein AUTU_25190 [Aureibacter tunicatorum]
MVPNKSNLSKLENILSKVGFKIRYEKGNFKSGFCLLNKNKIVILNKYISIPNQFEILKNLFQNNNISKDNLSEEEILFLKKLNL